MQAFSDGTAPGKLDPRAVAVMREAGVDISQQQSKHLERFLDMPLDLVVTVCGNASESCPTFPGQVQRIHHGFDDPPKLTAGVKDQDEALGHYRRVRDEIRAFVETLPQLLKPA